MSALNSDGVPVTVELDRKYTYPPENKHYCGRNLGAQPYGYASNQCSATNKCYQCKSCANLTAENRNRLDSIYNFVNSDGASVNLSYDNSSCPASHNGIYKFYCGKIVGDSGYHKQKEGLCNCNGVCGPNGCQCESCFQLDQKYM
jgi:hypothetical protein